MPSVVVTPLKVSVTVMFWLTRVGLPALPSLKAKLACPDADPSGVEAAVLSHAAVAVLVPALELGAAA